MEGAAPLLAIFGALAVVLCSMGIYCVLAYSVRRPMRDIGLRLAFGASLADVTRLVIVDGMKPTLAGIGVGLLCAFAVTDRQQPDLRNRFARGDDIPLCHRFAGRVCLHGKPAPGSSGRVDPLTVLRNE